MGKKVDFSTNDGETTGYPIGGKKYTYIYTYTHMSYSTPYIEINYT